MQTRPQPIGMRVGMSGSQPSLSGKTTYRSVLRSILMLDDTPHSIALGTAIGMFVGMTPTMGIQMAVVMFFAFLMRPFFRFNKIAGCLAVYITNPLTAIPIYWFQYKVGTFFVDGHISRDDFARVMQGGSLSEWFEAVKLVLAEIGSPLLVGSLIVATISGLATYPLMLWLIQRVKRGNGMPHDHSESSASSSAEKPSASAASRAAS